MKAEAVRIGKSDKEQIIVNDEVFIKSAPAGKWLYIVKVTEECGRTTIGKSSSLKNAEKWVPYPMFHEIPYGRNYDNAEQVKAFKERHPNWYKAQHRNRIVGSTPILKADIAYTREIVEIDRKQ